MIFKSGLSNITFKYFDLRKYYEEKVIEDYVYIEK